MVDKKRLLSAAALAGVLAFSLMSTASFAGPLIMGPGVAPMTPKVTAVPAMNAAKVQVKLLNAYREFRTFWLSRAIVR